MELTYKFPGARYERPRRGSQKSRIQKSKLLNPLPTDETSTCILVRLKSLLYKGYKMCKLEVTPSLFHSLPLLLQLCVLCVSAVFYHVREISYDIKFPEFLYLIISALLLS